MLYGCTLSYGDERGDRGMFSCLSEPPHLHPHPNHHHHNHFSSHLDVNAFSGLKADILKLSKQQPHRGEGGFTPLATEVSHTPAVCVNSLRVSLPACLPCPYVGIRMISQIPSVNKVTSDSSCAVLHANATQPFAFSLDKERLNEPQDSPVSCCSDMYTIALRSTHALCLCFTRHITSCRHFCKVGATNL